MKKESKSKEVRIKNKPKTKKDIINKINIGVSCDLDNNNNIRGKIWILSLYLLKNMKNVISYI